MEQTCAVCKKVFKQKGRFIAHSKACGGANTIIEPVTASASASLEPSDSNEDPNLIRYIDFFSGIGGFRYAIEAFAKESGKQFKCVLSVDIKKDAIATYNLNFGEKNEPCDIRKLKVVPAFDLLCAGFPCQPFSSAGKKEGFKNETSGNLIHEVIRICKEKKPKYLILENVSNIERLQNGDVLKAIIKEFEDIGYVINYKAVNGLQVGLAQDRERIFIVGVRRDLSIKGTIEIKCVEAYTKVGDIIDKTDTKSKLPPEFVNTLLALGVDKIVGKSLKDKRGGDDNLHSWDINYHGAISARQKGLMNEILLERRKKKWAEAKKIPWMDGMPLTLAEIKTFKDYPELADDLTELVEKHYLTLEKPKDLVGGKRVYKEDGLAGYNINKGKLSFPISKILDPDGQAPTLTATDSSKLAVLVGGTIRQLNLVELQRLCGFPETMRIADGVNMYDLYGNMVCPTVVLAILRCLFAETDSDF